MSRHTRLAQTTESVIMEAYIRFKDKPFTREDFNHITASFGPLYNTGYLKRCGNSINLTSAGITFAKKLIERHEEDLARGNITTSSLITSPLDAEGV